MTSIFLTNASQAILSFLFFTYNEFFSSMLLMQKWSDFIHERKVLRVSSLVDMQRSSFWLQFLYKYDVSLIVMFEAMHWLISQSIFLAHVIQLDDEDKVNSSNQISTCDYFNIAIINVIIVGSIIIILKMLTESRKYKKNMFLVKSCNAVISAACHSLKNNSDASLLSILWEIVEIRNSIKHCCFSNLNVSPPVKNKTYAELREMMILYPRSNSLKQPEQRHTERRDKPHWTDLYRTWSNWIWVSKTF